MVAVSRLSQVMDTLTVMTDRSMTGRAQRSRMTA
jgi:hypothetical protein